MTRNSRILLFAETNSINVAEDSLLLEVYGYQVVTYRDLHLPIYPHNRGMVPTDKDVNSWMALELLEGAIAVLHPDLKRAKSLEVALMCRVLRVPMLLLQDLDSQASAMTDECVDARNLANAPEYKPAPMYALPTEQPLVDAAHASLLVDHAVNQLQLDPVSEWTGPALPNMNATLKVVHHARVRSLRELVRNASRCCCRWMAQFNAYVGPALKNPMVREQQEAAAMQYRLQTEPLSTTG